IHPERAISPTDGPRPAGSSSLSADAPRDARSPSASHVRVTADIRSRLAGTTGLLACASLLVFLMSMQFGTVSPLLPGLSEGRPHFFAALVVGGHPIGSLAGALP